MQYKMVVLEVLIYLPNIGRSFSYKKILHKLRCRSESPRTRSSSRDRPTDTNSEDVVLDTLAGHGEHKLRHKLYSTLEHRRVILQWIPARCGIKGNAHADRLAKQGANMEQEKLPITLKQEKNNNEEQVQSKEDTR